MDQGAQGRCPRTSEAFPCRKANFRIVFSGVCILTNEEATVVCDESFERRGTRADSKEPREIHDYFSIVHYIGF